MTAQAELEDLGLDDDELSNRQAIAPSVEPVAGHLVRRAGW